MGNRGLAKVKSRELSLLASLTCGIFALLWIMPILGNGYAEDLDRDGLDEDLEYFLAKSFLPRIWYQNVNTESCPEPGAILYHVRPFVPGSSCIDGICPDGIAISYSVIYYRDCDITPHDFDQEFFALTIYPCDGSPSGYGLFSKTAVAHMWSGGISSFGCEWTSEDVFPNLVPGPEFSDNVQYEFVSDIYVADDGHAMYCSDLECDYTCWVFGDDCSKSKLMNAIEGGLVDEELGQYFDMYNIGEINDHILENLNQMDGLSFGNREVWGHDWSDRGLLLASKGRDYVPVDVSNNFVYYNPEDECSDKGVSFDISYRSLVRRNIHLLESGRAITYPKYLGEFCPGTDIQVRAWDGRDANGDCIPQFILLSMALSSQRGSDEALGSKTFYFDGSPSSKPNDPSNLIANMEEDEGTIELSWQDNSNNEVGFVVARKVVSNEGIYTCAFNNIAYPYNPFYVDRSVPCGYEVEYKVYAYNRGGFSGYSDAVKVTPQSLPPIEDLIVSGDHNEPIHDHNISWVFDYTHQGSFLAYVIEERDKYPYSEGPGSEWSDWQEIARIEDVNIHSTMHIGVHASKCYNYRVTASVRGEGCGYSTDVILTEHGHDCGPPPPPPGGCPILYPATGDCFSKDNNILAFSEVENGYGKDIYQLQQRLAWIPTVSFYHNELGSVGA